MTIQNIALNKLALSDLNVRKVKPKEIEALAADIQARGVLQNLIGYDEDGKIKICAGGRRYRALTLLQKGKKSGRESCREREWPYELIAVGAGWLKKKK